MRAAAQVVQETLHFDPASGAITSLRSKEEAHDYRYFPEPDLAAGRDRARDGRRRARAAMPELPAERAERCERELGLSAESARSCSRSAASSATSSRRRSARRADRAAAQTLANWVTGELVGAPRRRPRIPADSRVTPAALAALVGLVAAKRVSVGAGRQVLDRLVAEGGDPRGDRRGRGPRGDGRRARSSSAIVAAALAANADAAERVRAGNAKAIGPIVGHVMRETKGRADGTEVTRLINAQLGI